MRNYKAAYVRGEITRQRLAEAARQDPALRELMLDTRAFLRVTAAARVHAREGAKALWDGRRGLETNEVYAVILHFYFELLQL